MSTTPEETTGEFGSDAPSRPFPIAVLDLQEEILRMRTCPMPGGHYGRTLLRSPDMRMVVMILEQGTRLPEHHIDGTSMIQTLDGRVTVSLLGSSFDLVSGQVLAIERGVAHAVVATEHSAILLTIAWDGQRRLGNVEEHHDGVDGISSK